jgi:hypothetical protein
MNAHRIRGWMTGLLYTLAAAHLALGALLPWIADASLFDDYYRRIGAAFWHADPPAEASALQSWWVAMFGPSLQVLGLWMLLLVHQADRHHDVRLWRWLIAGLVLWAPQDVLISLRADCWPHVWIDAIALAFMLPPLLWLQRHDAVHGWRKASATAPC